MLRLKQLFLKAAGVLCLGLGAAGIVLPVLPTTPFVLAAALCFSFSSPELSAWLEKNRYFGPYIENYKNKTGVPLKQKILGVVFLWLMLVISMLIIQKPVMYLVLVMVGVAVTVHIALLKTRTE
jgi:uncharacterized membrane protein YbaN (DUF454 family)